MTTTFVISLLQLLALSSLTGAFVPFSSMDSAFGRQKISHLCAEGGAPQYDRRDAILRQAEVVGEGSVMLHIDIRGADGDDTTAPLDYQPGHVLALEIEEDKTAMTNEKNDEDTKNNGGWMRGPYTVSRGSEKSFDVLIKIVGDKSKRLASAEPGTTLKFGGKFKVPIYEGISKGTKRVVLLSTGVGVGPCIGAIEQMLADEKFAAKIDLFASFRREPEVISADYLDSLAAKHSHKFQWKAVVTSEMGRVSQSEENVRMITGDNVICSLQETHYHVIGNGQLVNEWKSGLVQAGVPEERVTVEAYFNHKAQSDDKAIENIAKVIAAASPVLR